MINSEQVLRIATSSIGNSKLRSALTTLGIMIGIAAVVTNVSPGIIGTSPLKSTSGELNYLFETRSVDITGVEEELERIQDIEIGIMKSLGYTYCDILSLFLLESVIVSLLGGVLGTIIGGPGAYILESLLKLPPVFPFRLIVVGVLTSIIVGVVAGIYPAKKAAKMNPVDALRYQ